uniref:C2H2-type domain-containing protein n=1 Tax=Trichogramma kaykai TaxID=54128 RepID=A0ABD2X746_9HYME
MSSCECGSRFRRRHAFQQSLGSHIWRPLVSVVLASDFIMGVVCSIYCQPCESSPRASTYGYPIASSSHSDRGFLPLRRLPTAVDLQFIVESELLRARARSHRAKNHE